MPRRSSNSSRRCRRQSRPSRGECRGRPRRSATPQRSSASRATRPLWPGCARRWLESGRCLICECEGREGDEWRGKEKEREGEHEREKALIVSSIDRFSLRLTFSLSRLKNPQKHLEHDSCPLGASTLADEDLLLSDVDPSGPLQRAVASSEMPDAFAVGFVKGKKKRGKGLSRSLARSLSLPSLAPPRLVLGVRPPPPLSLTHTLERARI